MIRDCLLYSCRPPSLSAFFIRVMCFLGILTDYREIREKSADSGDTKPPRADPTQLN